MNVMMLLEMATSGFGERVAYQSGEDRLTYAELFAAARSVAGELVASGAERLALLDVSSSAVPIGLFSSAWAGVPFVPLNYRLTGGELEALLERIAPAYLVTEEERADELGHLRDKTSTTVVRRGDFLAKADADVEDPSEWSMDPDEIALLLFTSGTTGAPKAAVLRQKHLVSYILSSVEFGAAGEEESTLVSVPPYHIAGMAAILSSVYSGRRIVQLPAFDAGDWVDLARSESVTHAFVVPTMLARIVDALGDTRDADLPNLRAISYGGGKMPLSVIERAMKLFPNANFTNAYGLTETSSTIAVLGPDEHRAAAQSEDPAERARLTAVGKPIPGVEVEIRDLDGKPLGPDQRGEIHVRGEQVSGEYLDREPAALGDGWFPTHDGGWLDAEGYLFLEGPTRLPLFRREPR